MMKNFVCTTCGVQYAASVEEPVSCHICDEERQYVNPKGQSWTTLENLQTSNTYKNEIIEEENGLYSITTKPICDRSNGICSENRFISFTVGLYYLFR